MGQDQVSGGVSVLCWLVAPVAMFYGNLQNLVIRSKSVIKSSLVISTQIGVMSDHEDVRRGCNFNKYAFLPVSWCGGNFSDKSLIAKTFHIYSI